jgi:hypothetical protein
VVEPTVKEPLELTVYAVLPIVAEVTLTGKVLPVGAVYDQEAVNETVEVKVALAV